MSAHLAWRTLDGVLELELRHPPCNEIGSQTLEELEAFLPELARARVLVVFSSLDAGFCAGADLRELYHRGRELDLEGRVAAVRAFLGRIHAVLNAIDAAPVPTIAAVHGVVFGGGFEVALACDLIVADRSARFAFPELRLGLIPGFGGIPRLKRDVSGALVRDLLLTGRSINATRAQQAGITSQVVGEGEALRAARAAARQILKFDAETAAAAKRFAKPIPEAELRAEIEVFVELFRRPVVQEALARFVDDEGPMPYLP
jgi:enoyl-CoA hydratase/carnithine racemase